MTAGNPEATKVAEYGLFDLLRFVLASAVVLSHIGALRWPMAGTLAVQVFFALSGWLIGGILLNTEARDLSRFYFNRATRIWVPYFVCVVALYSASLLHEHSHSARWFEFLTYDVTFTHNWFSLLPDAQAALIAMPLQGTGNHFWSIATEEQFYLLAPLIIVLMPLGKKVLPWVVIAAIACVAGEYTGLAYGVLAAVVFQRYPGWHRSVIGRLAVALVGCSAAFAMYLSAASFVWAAPVFAVGVVLMCALPMHRGAVARWLGGVSYPLYLNAWIGIFAINAIYKRLHAHESWPVTYLAALAAGAALYSLIDVQVMARRNRIYSPKLGWALGAVAYTLVLVGVGFWLIHTRPAAQ